MEEPGHWSMWRKIELEAIFYKVGKERGISENIPARGNMLQADVFQSILTNNAERSKSYKDWEMVIVLCWPKSSFWVSIDDKEKSRMNFLADFYSQTLRSLTALREKTWASL